MEVLRKFFWCAEVNNVACKNAFLSRPVGHYGPMSVGAHTTALAFAPESMQASSSPEQLRLLFRVRFKVSLSLTEIHWHFTAGYVFLICAHLFSPWLLSLCYMFKCFFRMWDLYGHSDRSGWLKLYLPLVWSAGFSHQHSPEVLHWTRSNTGV